MRGLLWFLAGVVAGMLGFGLLLSGGKKEPPVAPSPAWYTSSDPTRLAVTSAEGSENPLVNFVADGTTMICKNTPSFQLCWDVTVKGR